MEEQEFASLADSLWARIELALDSLEDVLDYETAENMLEMTFADGSQIVVTRHVARREIWVAAKSGGFHFCWDGADWRERRNGASLLLCLGELASTQAGARVRF
jgi:CyaY protein